MVEISQNIYIPEKELKFVFARASGPGGQNVNKVNTKVTLLFDVVSSPSLTEEQKTKIRNRLSTRISRGGVLRVAAMRYRSQKANREDAVKRFAELLSFALTEKPHRKKTKASRAARERRFQAKKQRSRIKQSRQKVTTE
ncbi:MAG: aminoacyl-tRNA hydrolase [Desulfobulbaceae bacterium]|jgi:ribosome-associated protein|nr:aminoacyl-tRNA hydrolase [Desulfobulbaceae bacterium]